MSGSGTVSQLWRYPVKSMGGTPVQELLLQRRGAHADRLWALRDLERDLTVSARRMPELLQFTARYAQPPGPRSGPGRAPEVIITLPEGTEVSSSDPGVHALLSAALNRPVRLMALASRWKAGQQRLSVQQMRQTVAVKNIRAELGIEAGEELPDVARFRVPDVLKLMRYSTPPGTFADLAPVHVITQTSVDTIAAALGQGPLDIRRFRPSLVLTWPDAVAGDLPEATWVGGGLAAPGVRLHVTMPTLRCVMPTRAQPGLAVDRAIGRALAQQANRLLGVYADVRKAGVVRVGDRFELTPAAYAESTTGGLPRALDAVRHGILRAIQQFLTAGK